MKRKEAIKIMATGALGAGFASQGASLGSTETSRQTGAMAGNINHSASRWCYGEIPLETLCDAGKKLGLTGIDLLKPSEIDVVQKAGLVCSMVNPEDFSLTAGFNDPTLHATLQQTYSDLIDVAASKRVTNLICFSGNRKGLSDEEGLVNCEAGLRQLVDKAQKKNIVLHMELLNSKVDHEDYQCDRTEWGVELCNRLGSDNFKLLYDIYHMQIMEGDIIRTIQDYNQFFGHYHTGGVPGRNEIDETQELNYRTIMKAVVATGFKGFVAQEFVPTAEDPIESLSKAIQICDV
ncbi:MAG: hydroxypyruvate isomerase [Cyclobacteriaceae bacterium]|jgi:hydroxypyruvate isomerase